MASVADIIVDILAANGVRRIFGIPGGGASLDLLEAAGRRGLDFILTRTENAAVMMAAATAEATGSPGVALATRGPGLANAVNGIAQAWLDRNPVLMFAECLAPGDRDTYTHQLIDQAALGTPITKSVCTLTADDAGAELLRQLQIALTPVRGPVLIELPDAVARSETASPVPPLRLDSPAATPDLAGLAAAGDLLAAAEMPALLVGLECNAPGVADRVVALADELGCPVFTTYKAKGVVPDTHPGLVGTFTGGSAEAETLEQADLIVLAGLDPVELIPRPWRYVCPVLDISLVRHPVHYMEPAAGVYGSLDDSLRALAARAVRGEWRQEQLSGLRAGMRSRLSMPGGDGLNSQEIVESIGARVGGRTTVTIDAGAHMFSAMAFWSAERAASVFISNGLASMGYALPAAIAVSLERRDERVIAFTGDGGLLMCLGELATAVQHRCRLIVVVFNDRTLSLIAIKQRARGFTRLGVDGPAQDFAAVMAGLGGLGLKAGTPAELESALAAALAHPGPALIDVATDPAHYPAQLRGLRE